MISLFRNSVSQHTSFAVAVLLVITAASLGQKVPPEVAENWHQWPLPHKDYANTRATFDSAISSETVHQLQIAWTFPIEVLNPGRFGNASTGPIIAGNTVYFQDLGSNIAAINLASGDVKWQQRFNASTFGPNGAAIGWGKVFATRSPTQFSAFDVETGRELWTALVALKSGEGALITAMPFDNTLYLGTVGSASGAGGPGGVGGRVFALNQESGEQIWQFNTVAEDFWGNPRINHGSGIWYPCAIDENRDIIYAATANPDPFPGTSQFPNGSSRPGPNLYTNSMIALDRHTGELKWYNQVTPHDLFDLDFAMSPILATVEMGGTKRDVVVGAGKSGRVIAFDRDTGQILWNTAIGFHLNDDLTELPAAGVSVAPAASGGTLTPLAYAGGVVYVGVNNNPWHFTPGARSRGGSLSGEFVALAGTGQVLWSKEFDSRPLGGATVVNDLVFTALFNGMILALDRLTGQEVWSYQTGGGITAWPAVCDDFMVFPVGIPGSEPAQLIAFKLPEVDPIRTYASRPNPANGATTETVNVTLQWKPGGTATSHEVLLSSDSSSVLDGSAKLAVVNDKQFTVEPLEYGTTYTWQINEINEFEAPSMFFGDLWTFTTPEFGVIDDMERYILPPAPVVDTLRILPNSVTATASGTFAPNTGPEKTIDGSGLSAELHGTAIADMWVSDSVPAWIRYEFDRPYKLREMWIWNANQFVESVLGVGARDIVIEHSLDGETWSILEGIAPLAQAPGSNDYAHNNAINMKGTAAQYVRITVNSVHGPSQQTGLSEVRFYAIPTYARLLQPTNKATTKTVNVRLHWKPGITAASHEVLLSGDPEAIQDGSAIVAVVDENLYTTGALDFGKTYFWQVNEINEAETPAKYFGDLWTFTTPEFGMFNDTDHFENEDLIEIASEWVDGANDPANGSMVGANPSLDESGPETRIVHSGEKSLPIWFDNGTTTISEATRTFAQVQDWTQSGIQTLVLYFANGDQSVGGQLYARINDSKVVFQDSAALPPGWWTQWNIDLTSLGVNLTEVKSLTIGVEGSGALGVVYVDDIRVYKNAPEPEQSRVLNWFEAESGTITAPMQILSDDPTASAGQYITVPNGGGNAFLQPPTDGLASYSFTVPEDGEYRFAFRVITSTNNQDSFWVRIPVMKTNTTNHASGWVRFNEIKFGNSWHWDEVHSNDDRDQVVDFTLTAGTHTLEVAYREDGTLLDAIAVLAVGR